PQNSAACLPWAHQVACRPAFEKAALSGFSERPISAAMAAPISGSKPIPPSTAAAPAGRLTVRMKARRGAGGTLGTIVNGPSRLGVAEFPMMDFEAGRGLAAGCRIPPDLARSWALVLCPIYQAN